MNSEDQQNRVTVGCCNFSPTWADKTANLEKILTMTKTAAEMGCNLVVFPELALTGYECENQEGCSQSGLHKKLAEPIPGPSTRKIQELAASEGLHVIVGLPEIGSQDRRVIYDSAVLVGPKGILGIYRKITLGAPPVWSEQLCFSGGAGIMKEIPVFETPFGGVGISICYDFWRFPEISRIQALKGAELLVNPTAGWSAPGGEPQSHMEIITAARATENICYAMSANMVGKERTKEYYGHSTIAGPDYYRQTRIYAVGGKGEEIVTASLSLDELHLMRRRLPYLEDRRKFCSALVLDELRRLS
ncbi:MAG TPA: carbon-nitrogen hydrolase family protein [Candidatus Bathyarchaeia archaeon]|nr:carbon-nitrogen hydrolase family protein [Candidatus Bathyarchaeia archaeon]